MKKIIVAEDDKFLLSAYRLKLSKLGIDIKVATNGEEVFKILVEFNPDLILLDLVMPVKDGFAVLKELKANPNYKDIPVIVASNLGQKEDIDRATSLGADDFIIKSNLSLAQLVQKIENAI
jgi:two-component system phosphate regulon response regulator PhoB/two-component system alkaline phosphatase synthesis response regulator PhoP